MACRCPALHTYANTTYTTHELPIPGTEDDEQDVRRTTHVCFLIWREEIYLWIDSFGLIHTGHARVNSNANPFMLHVCSVSTPIHARGFHLLCVALCILCGWGLFVCDQNMQRYQNLIVFLHVTWNAELWCFGSLLFVLSKRLNVGRASLQLDHSVFLIKGKSPSRGRPTTAVWWQKRNKDAGLRRDP